MNEIENTQEIESVLNFLGMHMNNNGCTLSREFQLIDMTEYCQNFNDSNRMYLIISHPDEFYFYTRRLGLIEFEVKQGGKFIPEFLEIDGDELNKAFKKIEEFGEIVNLVIMNPPKKGEEMELVTVEDTIIECLNAEQTGNKRYEISYSVKTTYNSGTRKCYIVDEIFDNDIEYKIIRDDIKGNINL